MANNNFPFKDMEITVKTPNGTQKVKLQWASGTQRKYDGLFQKAQEFIDIEVLRGCSKRVPFKSGDLRDSGLAHSKIGSGLLVYDIPYARKQYYSTAQSRSYDPNRGAGWFHRTAAVERTRILAGAKRIIGGGG